MEKKRIQKLQQNVKTLYLTPKTLVLNKKKIYCFLIDPSLKKPEIKIAFEHLFTLNTRKINTCNVPPKIKRVKNFRGYIFKYKKVFITCK